MTAASPSWITLAYTLCRHANKAASRHFVRQSAGSYDGPLTIIMGLANDRTKICRARSFARLAIHEIVCKGFAREPTTTKKD
jgi:hypothetical protein